MRSRLKLCRRQVTAVPAFLTADSVGGHIPGKGFSLQRTGVLALRWDEAAKLGDVCISTVHPLPILTHST